MKKNDKAKQEQKPQCRVLKKPKGVTELTEQDLEQVQGGQGINSAPSRPDKVSP